jgi:protein subunit release factor B
VQLKHLPTGIVVKCQETRSRDQNRDMARRQLADRVEHTLNAEESRVALKAREAAKKRASKLKKTKRKYRKLEEAKQAEKTNPDFGEKTEMNITSNSKLADGPEWKSEIVEQTTSSN